jgi:hypothetical protein
MTMADSAQMTALKERYAVTTKAALVRAIQDEYERETDDRPSRDVAAVLLDQMLDAEFQRIEGAPPVKCESGWTGDRCQLPLHHEGPHDNEETCPRCGYAACHCSPAEYDADAAYERWLEDRGGDE